eukprot:6172075-Pleurochrysis_carterae.AAC.4
MHTCGTSQSSGARELTHGLRRVERERVRVVPVERAGAHCTLRLCAAESRARDAPRPHLVLPLPHFKALESIAPAPNHVRPVALGDQDGADARFGRGSGGAVPSRVRGGSRARACGHAASAADHVPRRTSSHLAARLLHV